MPELPEVEVVRRGLSRWISGRRVASVEVLHPRAVRRHDPGPADFAARITGHVLGNAHRRGKYLWLPLHTPADRPTRDAAVGAAAPAVTADRAARDAAVGAAGPAVTADRPAWGAAGRLDRDVAAEAAGTPAAGPEFTDERGGREAAGGRLDRGVAAEMALVAHLGMSGQMLVGEAERVWEKHLRVRFTFDDGGMDLRFVDQRTFGGMMVAEMAPDVAATTRTSGLLPAPIAHIAADPLDPAFDEAAFTAALRRKDTELKRALLDQSLISGVGNIYADEALWEARLHGRRATGTLTRPDVARVVAAVREVMAAALDSGGTSFDSLYVNVNGESGYFSRSLRVYGLGGHPCGRCGTPIGRERFMNRSSHFCPVCQRKR